MGYVPIHRMDRIKLRMAYRRLHIAAGNCLPPGWMEETNATGAPAKGGCDPHRSQYISNMVGAYRNVFSGPMSNEDLVTSFAVWSYQFSNGASVSELRKRIDAMEDYVYRHECQIALDILVSQCGLVANTEISPYLRKLRKERHDNQHQDRSPYDQAP